MTNETSAANVLDFTITIRPLYEDLLCTITTAFVDFLHHVNLKPRMRYTLRAAYRKLH
jgi:hypothetical protein